MFNLAQWLIQGIIEGYETGEFSRPAVVTMSANYIARGILTEADAAAIDAACPPVVEQQEEGQG